MNLFFKFYAKFCRFSFKMPWNTASWIIYVCLIIELCFINFGFTVSQPVYVYFNKTNPRFHSGDYMIHINQLDTLEIYCPLYNNTVEVDKREYYKIYLVSKENYENCTIPIIKPNDLIADCTTPLQERRYTIIIRSFSGIPGSKDYPPGTYYFITTSTGSQGGISNQYQGACTHHNMKVKMEVCCKSTTGTVSPGTNNPDSTNGPSPNTPRPSPVTTRTRTTSISTTKRTTTPTTTTTTTTKHTTQKTPNIIPTTNLPGGKPHDPTDIIIDAPGTLTNVGTINSARTLQPSSYVLLLTSFLLLTFSSLSR